MRLAVVSDVHGEVDAIRGIGDDVDAVLCLGDLVSFVDYADHGGGIMGELFGAEAVGTYVRLRTERRFEQARTFSQGLWGRLQDPRGAIEAAVRGQYVAIFGALAELPAPVYATYGNVDLPALWPELAPAAIAVHDGTVADVGGLRVGFVGGGLRTPMRTPHEISDEEYAAKVDAVVADGPLDVLASHIPPQLPDLLYDTVAGRYERGSTALLAAIQDHQPAYALFGHVHQAHTRRLTVGRTRCVNVGHFRGRRRPTYLQV